MRLTSDRIVLVPDGSYRSEIPVGATVQLWTADGVESLSGPQVEIAGDGTIKEFTAQGNLATVVGTFTVEITAV